MGLWYDFRTMSRPRSLTAAVFVVVVSAFVGGYFGQSALATQNRALDRYRVFTTTPEHPAIGRQPMLGRPYIFEKTPWRIRSAAPSPGEHTDSVLAGAGYSPREIQQLRDEGVAA